MIAAAIVCAAAFAQASSYNWRVSSGWVSPDGDNALEGAKVYFFDANVYSSTTLISALGTDGTKAFENAFATTGTVTDGGEFNFNGTGLTDDGGTPAYASGYIAILMTGTDNKDYAYVTTDVAPVKITEAIIGGSVATFTYDDIVTGEVGGDGWTKVTGGPGPTPVPEPTSGLMLLLGMGALALRRRRA